MLSIRALSGAVVLELPLCAPLWASVTSTYGATGRAVKECVRVQLGRRGRGAG